MSTFPTTPLHYIASDGCALLIRESIDAMDDQEFGLYMKYHFATCEREDLQGVTSPAPLPGRSHLTLIHEICIKTADKPSKR